MPSITDKFGKASISSDVAIATTVKTTRAAGVSVLEAIDLSKYATDTPVFVVTYGKTTDPVTGIVTITKLRSWKALVNTGANTLTNLTIQPGYADDIGNIVGDFIECIPTSAWENSLIDGLFVGHNPDGSFKKAQLITDLGGDAANPIVRGLDTIFDHVAGGGAVLAGLGYAANLNASLSSGIVYINGERQLIAAVASRAYTASKDTYVDALYNASGTATIVYTEVTNNAASPALAANSVRLGIVVSGAANIAAATSINQGQNDRVLPIASSIPYSVTDSLGNLICPRDPNRRTLGYKQRITDFVTVAGGATLIPELSVPIIVPSGRKIKATLYTDATKNDNASVGQAILAVYEGSIAGTSKQQKYWDNGVANKYTPMDLHASWTPASGAVTINATVASVGQTTLSSASFRPIFLLIELA